MTAVAAHSVESGTRTRRPSGPFGKSYGRGSIIMTIDKIKFNLEIESGSVSMTESPFVNLEAIFEDIMDSILLGKSEGFCFDRNGNRVGSWSYEEVSNG
jgi:hypothetical protein